MGKKFLNLSLFYFLSRKEVRQEIFLILIMEVQ